MNGKKKWILAAVALAVLLAAAVILYQALKGQGETGGLADLQGTAQSQTQQNGQTSTGAQIAESAGETQQEEKMLAPDFTVWDNDGNEVKLSELLNGKPTVLNFWASTCPPCQMEMPDFHDVYQELEGEVQFLMIDGIGSLGETEEKGRAYMEEQGYTFPVYYDREMEAVMTYGISSFPTTYFIDEEGYLVAGGIGMLSREYLMQGIDMIT
nr:TlpA disulfide reductase family protein [uncultured Solibaculum sp.]